MTWQIYIRSIVGRFETIDDFVTYICDRGVAVSRWSVERWLYSGATAKNRTMVLITKIFGDQLIFDEHGNLQVFRNTTTASLSNSLDNSGAICDKRAGAT